MADGVKVGGGFFGQSSFSKFAIVTESSVVNLDGTIQNVDELKLFAPLGCGLQTGAASLLKRAMATASDTVAVIGLGGVGMAAIMVRHYLRLLKTPSSNHSRIFQLINLLYLGCQDNRLLNYNWH
jgi:Zn-dependent alcohol dehydrogenase